MYWFKYHLTMSDLRRFDIAQFDTYETAIAELQQGRKVTHWMWFIFPQLKALGRSSTAKFYGIADLNEARAYLADPDLGPRLAEACKAVLWHRGRSAEEIFGKVDALKLRSCATLFYEAAEDDSMRQVFHAILVDFYAGKPCDTTWRVLKASQP